MARYEIEIDEVALGKQFQAILNDMFADEMHRKYSETGHMISDAVKELVYSHKDEIVDKVVDRAVKEIVRKGIPKLMERMANNG